MIILVYLLLILLFEMTNAYAYRMLKNIVCRLFIEPKHLNLVGTAAAAAVIAQYFCCYCCWWLRWFYYAAIELSCYDIHLRIVKNEYIFLRGKQSHIIFQKYTHTQYAHIFSNWMVFMNFRQIEWFGFGIRGIRFFSTLSLGSLRIVHTHTDTHIT